MFWSGALERRGRLRSGPWTAVLEKCRLTPRLSPLAQRLSNQTASKAQRGYSPGAATVSDEIWRSFDRLVEVIIPNWLVEIEPIGGAVTNRWSFDQLEEVLPIGWSR
jgi:hypothetical protein